MRLWFLRDTKIPQFVARIQPSTLQHWPTVQCKPRQQLDQETVAGNHGLRIRSQRPLHGKTPALSRSDRLQSLISLGLLQSFLTNTLNSHLGQFCEIGKVEPEVGLSQIGVELHNVEVNVSAFDNLQVSPISRSADDSLRAVASCRSVSSAEL